MKKDVLAILKQHTEDYLSGAKIAQMLGVSRAAVWKSVESLRNDGYVINAVTNAGYQLENNHEIIDTVEISSYLNTTVIGKEIEFFEEVSSTNEVAKSRAKSGSPEGYVVIADQQTSGKGRYGREFFSPKHGGIYMSLILRPTWDVSNIGLITVIAAVAVSRAIKQTCGVDVGIKWVNDLFVNGKKVCGILTEAGFEVESASLNYAVVGIGVNVAQHKFPETLSDIAANVSECSSDIFSVNRLIAAILNQFEYSYLQETFESVLEEYRRRSIVLGNQIVFEYQGKEMVGFAEAIDDDGALIVTTAEKKQIRLLFGEVSVRMHATED